jgi:hypothetical protein
MHSSDEQLTIGLCRPTADIAPADIACVVGCAISFLVVCRVLFVYRQLRLDDQGHCNAACFKRAVCDLARNHQILYGAPDPHENVYAALIAQTSPNFLRDTTVVSTSAMFARAGGGGGSQPPPPASYGSTKDDSSTPRPTLFARVFGRAFDGYDQPVTLPFVEPRQHAVDTGVTIEGLLHWVSWIQNPFNDMQAMVVLVQLVQVFAYFCVSVASLVRRDDNFYCYHGTGAENVSPQPAKTEPLCFESQRFTPAFCDFSATTTQFVDSTATACMIFLCLMLAVPSIPRWFRYRRARWMAAFLLAAFLVGVGTTALMWLTLPTQPWGSKFSRGMPWCWLPTQDYTGQLSATDMAGLRTVLCYMNPLLIMAIGFVGYRRVKNAITAHVAKLFSGTAMPFMLPLGYKSILRRSVLQFFIFIVVYGFGAISRYLPGAASNPGLSAVCALLFSLLPTLNAVVWLHGEGILRAAMGFSKLERAVGRSLSQLIINTYGLKPMHLSARNLPDALQRGSVPPSDGDGTERRHSTMAPWLRGGGYSFSSSHTGLSSAP